MVVKHTPRHEHIDARVWDSFMSRWWPLAPWDDLDLQARSDWSVDTGTLTLSADHPQLPRLRQCRHVPVPVTFTINGVHWDGYVESVETGQNEDGTQYARVNLWSEHKHFHRMLARSTVASAADSSAETITSSIGELTERLVSRGAVRTGLPTYVLVESEGDPVEVELRTEDYVADVLSEPLAGSDSFIEVRKLLPGQELPGKGVIRHYCGVMERQWMEAELNKGRWPNAKPDARIYGDSLGVEHPAMPDNSWHGAGRIRIGLLTGEDEEGICWIPFETVVDRPLGYYATVDPKQVFVVGRDEVAELAGAQAHRPHFVTEWWPGTFYGERVGKLERCAREGLLRTTSGRRLTASAAKSYIGRGAAYAWKEGVEWVLANPSDFEADNRRYASAGKNQKQTPGIFVWQHQGRDRRGVVFSSAPGGGLRKWSTTETGPDGAMLIGGGQLDAQTIAALESGVLQPKGTVGTVDASTAAAYLPGSAGFPDEVEQLDIDVQPHATIAGTEVSFSKAGGRVNIAQAGPFFLREKYMNLSSIGGTNPTSDIAREWARSQGTTSMSLAPGHHETVVFGDDIRLPDGRVVPGWRPGDRVSFVDRDTRVSEVIMGYTLKASSREPLSVEPILGREDNGVMASLRRRVEAQERAGRKALLAPSRKVPKRAVQEIVDVSADKLSESFKASYERYSKALTQLGDKWRQELKDGLSAEQQARVEALREEQLARQRAGTDLRGQLEKTLDDAVGKERSAREAAIRAEESARQSDLFTERNVRNSAIAEERRARQAAIAAEEQARALAVSNEARARQSAISDLSESFTTELEVYDQLIDEAGNSTDEATKKVVQFWSEENQNNFNKAVQLTLAAQRAYNDVNNIKWVSQDAWNEQQEKINEAREKFEAQQLEINIQDEKFKQQQEQINAQNDEFRRLTEKLDAQQTEQINQITAVQQQMADESQGQIRELMASPGGTSDKNVKVNRSSDGTWSFTIDDAVKGSMLHAKWYKGTFGEGGRITVNHEDIRVIEDTRLRFTPSSDTPYIYLRWAAATKKQVTVDKSDGSWTVSRGVWDYRMSYPAPSKTIRNAVLRLKVTWAAATYDDNYGIRIRAGDRILRKYSMTGLGPKTVFGDGERWMSTMVSSATIYAGETIKVDVFSTAALSGGRRVKRAELTGTWLEEV